MKKKEYMKPMMEQMLIAHGLPIAGSLSAVKTDGLEGDKLELDDESQEAWDFAW